MSTARHRAPGEVPNPTDGTPDTLPPIGPLTVTGALGDTVVIQNKNPGGTPLVGAGINEPRIVADVISFRNADGNYAQQLPVDCAYDTRPPDTSGPIGPGGSVPKPVASWVDQIEIPIGVDEFGPPRSPASPRPTGRQRAATR